MHLFNQRIAGIIILLLWAMLVVVKAIATGSLLKDRPRGGVWVWLIHIYNFLFLLVAAPLAAVLMIVRNRQAFGTPGWLTGLGVLWPRRSFDAGDY